MDRVQVSAKGMEHRRARVARAGLFCEDMDRKVPHTVLFLKKPINNRQSEQSALRVEVWQEIADVFSKFLSRRKPPRKIS